MADKQTVTMYGAAFTAEGELVEREVAQEDVVAFERDGYVKGKLPAGGGPARPRPELQDAAPAAPEASKALKGKLPEGFPGLAALEAEGLTTYAKVRKHLDSIQDVAGIGPATAEEIREAMKAEEEPE